MEYTSYERVKAALEHREPDRIPYDLGGSVLTGINRHAYKRLREYLGMPAKNIEICDVMQQLARVDEDLIDRLKVDVRCVDPSAPAKKGLAQDITREGAYYRMTDEWGIEWRMPIWP
jgi:uroporphyrinogen decarboxylase